MGSASSEEEEEELSMEGLGIAAPSDLSSRRASIEPSWHKLDHVLELASLHVTRPHHLDLLCLLQGWLYWGLLDLLALLALLWPLWHLGVGCV